MNCDDARSAYLSFDSDPGVAAHFASCAACAARRDALDETRAVLDDARVWEEPPSNMEERLVAAIAGPPDEVRREPGSRLLWLGSVAAAIVVAFGFWFANLEPAPDWEIALPGTAEAPNAIGTVAGWNEAGGTRLALAIEGLPPAPPGFVYEFWLTSGDIHISAGTFTAPDGVELWVGVGRADFPRLWITLEPIDEDESPSGINVMDTA